MARNVGRRGGRVRDAQDRGQFKDPRTALWTRRDTATGRFLEAKKSGGTLRGVRKER